MPRNTATKDIACQLCGTTRRTLLRRAMIVRPAIAHLMQSDVSQWDEQGWICLDDLQKYQHCYVQSLLEAERGELSQLELGDFCPTRQNGIFQARRICLREEERVHADSDRHWLSRGQTLSSAF